MDGARCRSTALADGKGAELKAFDTAIRVCLFPMLAVGCTSLGTVGSENPFEPPQPPAQSVLVAEGFEDTAFGARGWYDIINPQVTGAEAAVGGSSLVMRFAEGAQFVDGTVGRHLFEETDVVVLSYWVKYSANWVGSQVSSHPHEFYFLTNLDDAFVGPAGAVLEVLVEQNHNGVDGMVPFVGVRGRRMWASAMFTDAPGPRYKGDWHFIEAEIRMNSGVGVADGEVRYWMDGELLVDERDVVIRANAGEEGMRFNQLLIAPFIGVGSPVDQTMWIDDLRVATATTEG